MNSNHLPEVAVVGSVNIDITAYTPRLPAAGETVGNGVLLRDVGGKGANQAAAASRLGAKTKLISAVGRDTDGDWALKVLEDAGVDTKGVSRSDLRTGTALIVVDEEGENQIAVCPGANSAVSSEDITFRESDVVIAQLEISFETVLRLSQKVPGYLAINASPARRLPALLVDRADLIVVNESEFLAMPELRDATTVAVTYGSRGAALLRQGLEAVRVDGMSVTPTNTVGAGDAFCSALVLALQAGLGDEEALTVACRVGAEAVTSPSPQPAFQHLDAYMNG